MAEPGSNVAVAVGVYAVLVLVPVTAFWLVLHAFEIGARAVAIARKFHLLPPPPVRTYDPPIERIASDLRRLSAEMAETNRYTPVARRRGLMMAYDDHLIAACKALELPHTLATLPEGTARELERMRVEIELERAGLRFRPAA